METHQPNTSGTSDLSEAVKLKLMDVAMRFAHDHEDFVSKYLWLYNQALSIRMGSIDRDQHSQTVAADSPSD